EELPAAAAKAKNYAAWNKSFATWLFRMQKVDLMRSPGLGELSKAGESERDFRVRLQQAAREQRDKMKADLQGQYGPKLQQIQMRKQKAQQRQAAEKQHSTAQILTSVVTAGAGILS